MKTFKLYLVLGLVIFGISAIRAEAQQSELQLKPCTIELVDGTKVEGKLAVQFDMDDHLIVYSPRLATVRSFLKNHVHALTVDGERIQLNARRNLTDEEQKLIGQVSWPDEPPSEGFKPAYTTQAWSKPKRLLVWTKPGKSGRFGRSSNWRANGTTLKENKQNRFMFKKRHGKSETDAAFTPNTDFLIPVSAKSYQVRGVAHWKKGSFMCRHLTVGGNASFQHNLDGLYGNLWVSPHGSFNGGGNAPFRGSKNTFLRNGLPRPGVQPVSDPQKLEAKKLARKWELRKEDPDASMEIIGSAKSGDETHVYRGRLIVSENSTVLIGPRCTQTIYKGGTLQLQSGAYFGKYANTPTTDMVVKGTMIAGSPRRPLKRDCYLGLGTSDWQGQIRELQVSGRKLKSRGDVPMHLSLLVPESGKIRVHSNNPARAKLVFDWHGDASTGSNNGASFIRLETERQKRLWRQIKGKICAYFAGDVQFNGVKLDHFHEGGIMVPEMAMRRQWQHVSYGDRNAGTPDELYATIPKYLNNGNWDYPDDAPVPQISPIPKVYVQGRDSVRVKLNADAPSEAQIRYTLDGTVPDAEATVYEGPFTLKETAIVKARCFKHGQRLGPPARAKYKFVELAPLKPANQTDTESGLMARFYEKADRYANFKILEKSKPKKTGVVKQVGLDLSGGEPAVIAFEGYLHVNRPGVYYIDAVTDKPRTGWPKNFCKLSLGDHEVFREVWFRTRSGEVRQSGVVRLKAGNYPLDLAGVIEGSKFELHWQGPGMNQKQPIPAGALRH